MSVRGKRSYQWVVATYCDFGSLDREAVLCRHFSMEAARKAWKRWKRWYSHQNNYTLWQKTAGGVVINSMQTYGHKTYGPQV